MRESTRRNWIHLSFCLPHSLEGRIGVSFFRSTVCVLRVRMVMSFFPFSDHRRVLSDLPARIPAAPPLSRRPTVAFL